ncbi:hypothetical protein ABK040_015672 [Willaertia magna]
MSQYNNDETNNGEFPAQLILSYHPQQKTELSLINKENNNTEELLPFMYLGSYSAAEIDLEKLQNKYKVTHILNVTEEIPVKYKKHLICKQITLQDSPRSEINKFFKEAHDFIEDCKLNNGCILIHCQAGISRSTTFVLSFLMKYFKMNLQKSYSYVKSIRSVVNPNLGFIQRLIFYEKELELIAEFNYEDYCVEWIGEFIPQTDKEVIRKVLREKNGDVDDAMDVLFQ